LKNKTKNVKTPEKSNPKAPQSLRRLSKKIGDFIRYWGFRRIHGQIWTHLYLSPGPLTASQLVSQLRVSKALISPALKELKHFKLIQSTPGEDARSKKFSANPQVLEVIRGILKQREAPLLTEIYNDFQTFKNDPSSPQFSSQRLQELETMIFSAKMALELLVHLDSFEDLQKMIISEGNKT
jgi:DNA-binding transcriptional regulator GbsR (MarR family)